ncbi:MAG: divergent PAP2 family protein [Treponema sp.]|nr:divergent PAP2 family protein [Treponema sp.]
MVDGELHKSNLIMELFANKTFLSSLLSLCSAQILKGVFSYLSRHTQKKNKRELAEVVFWSTGGMPSSHAAIVCSLCTSIAYVEGLASNLFILSFWFALVVLRDAIGVRRLAGLLAKTLNTLGKQTAEKTGISFRAVKEIQGHTPLEVVVGGLLGIAVALVLNVL